MRKVVLCFLVALITVSANSQMLIDKNFNEVYQKALQLNAGRFVNLNKIQIGDTIVFPAHTGSGTEFWIADAPANGVNDCIWRLTSRYLKGQLITTPVKFTEPVWFFNLPIPAKETASFWSSNLFWKLLIGIMILLTLVYLVFFRRYMKDSDIDANPVLPGGLSNDASRAMQQINGITAGLQIVKVERGRIFGTSSKKVKMSFSDKDREVSLVSGDSAYRVTEFDGKISFYRQHCGNLIAPIASGQFSLPDDWVFVPNTDTQSTWSVPETAEEVLTKEAESKSTDVYLHDEDSSILSGLDIANILKNIGEMKLNCPIYISVGDLSIEFSKPESK